MGIFKFKIGDAIKIIKVGEWPVLNNNYNNFNSLLNKQGIISNIYEKWRHPDGGYIDLYLIVFSQSVRLPNIGGIDSIWLSDNNFILIESLQNTMPSSCPRCKKQDWKEVYSDWAKKNIKKCKNCGWC
jgi:hypothetical protein